MVFKDFQGLSGRKDKRDLQEKMERTESQARWVAVVLLDLMELLVGWVILVLWDQEGHRARKAREVHLVNLDLQGPLGLLARAMEWTWLP